MGDDCRGNPDIASKAGEMGSGIAFCGNGWSPVREVEGRRAPSPGSEKEVSVDTPASGGSAIQEVSDMELWPLQCMWQSWPANTQRWCQI